jgi:hypothetical protein
MPDLVIGWVNGLGLLIIDMPPALVSMIWRVMS